MATGTENTRVSSEILDEARLHCDMTGKILRRFIDDSIEEKLKRDRLVVNTVAVDIHENGETIEKGEGW